jgi:hypothetical protein
MVAAKDRPRGLSLLFVLKAQAAGAWCTLQNSFIVGEDRMFTWLGVKFLGAPEAPS